MKYNNIEEAIFISRPNRFIANILIHGKEELCHVKNTGRCKELLAPGCTVYVEVHNDPKRKTNFSLIGVKKGELMINMDSQAPNKVVGEWLKNQSVIREVTKIRPETKYGNSRFDFYVETKEKKVFLEVKGVTLEMNGIAYFPDAPTERGIKHIEELCACMEDGYEAYIIFVIQLKGITRFQPNDSTHQAFGDVLRKAADMGVHILAYDCIVTENELRIDAPVPVCL